MAASTPEPKRVQDFRLSIAKSIPKFPNNGATLRLLEEKSLASLLIDYANWAHRLIPPRPRAVTIEPTLTADPRWKTLEADTTALLERARQGADLNPYVSLRALRNGFTPASSATTPDTDKWEDKDFLLNVMGYHHLHLSQVIESTGYAKRTSDVLFVQLTRSTLNAIGYFDHSVFEAVASPTSGLTAERSRLWEIFDKRNAFGKPPGSVYISTPITTSGHSLHHTSLAVRYSELIYTIDPKLDDIEWRATAFAGRDSNELKTMKLAWHLNYLDLSLLEKGTPNFFVLKYGPF